MTQRDDWNTDGAWRDIPKSALEQSRRNDTAKAWAQEQYASIAQDWAAMQRQGAPAQAEPATADVAPNNEVPPLTPATASTAPGGDWQAVAFAQLNKPYIWGSAGGRSDFGSGAAGFDCSGYVSYVLKNGLGIDLPAFTGSAYQKTSAIPPKEAQPGDVVFYNMDNPDPRVQHIAIYIGDGKIIQAGGTARNVNVASVSALGTPEFRRPSGQGAAQSRTFVGSAGAILGGDVSAEGVRQYGTDAPSDTLTDAQRATIARLQAEAGTYNTSGQYGPDAQDSTPVTDGLTDAQRQTIARLQAEAEGPIAPPVGAPIQREPLPTGPGGIPNVNAIAQSAYERTAALPPADIGAARHEWERDMTAAVTQANPLRDVPLVGGLTTGLGVAAVDPLTYIGGPILGEAAGAVAKPVLKAAGSALGRAFPEEVAYASTQAGRASDTTLGRLLRTGDDASGPVQILGPKGEVLSTVSREAGEAIAREVAQLPDDAAQATAARLTQELAQQPASQGAASWADKAIAIRYASLLSSWRTHLANITSNAGQTVVPALEDLAAGRPGVAGARLRGVLEGIPDGVSAFVEAMRHGATQASKAEQIRPHAFGEGPLGRAIGVPTDLLAAADDFFKAVNTSGFLRAEATKMANGDPSKLAAILRDPPAALVERAAKYARSATYQEDPGAVVGWLMEGRKMPGLAGLGFNFVLPFVRTPANIFRRGVAYTAQPITGPVKIVAALAKGDTEAARQEAGRTLIAGAFTAAFAAKAANGELSGNGPASSAERAKLEATGWKPNSIKVGDTWVDYRQMGPLAVQLATIANAWEAMQDAGRSKTPSPPWKVAQRVLGEVKDSLLDQSYLGGVFDLFRFSPASTAAGYATSLVPFGGAIAETARTLDPYQRKVDRGDAVTEFGQSVAQRFPVARDTVPTRDDFLGRPQPNDQTGLATLVPYRFSMARQDVIVRTLVDADVGVPAAPRTWKNVPLTPDEQRRFADLAGTRIEARIAALKGQATPTTLKAIVDKAREDAGAEILRGIDLAEANRRRGQTAQPTPTPTRRQP